jgi:hypothetical protein
MMAGDRTTRLARQCVQSGGAAHVPIAQFALRQSSLLVQLAPFGVDG